MNKSKTRVSEVVDYTPCTLYFQWLWAADDQPRTQVQSVVLLCAGVIGPLESHTVDLVLISTPGYIQN